MSDTPQPPNPSAPVNDFVSTVDAKPNANQRENTKSAPDPSVPSKRTKRKRTPPQRFMVPVGYRCGCDFCEAERDGRDHLWRAEVWCAGCGHGYIIVGGDESSCRKCGSVGAWTEERPDLPVAPLRPFIVHLQRVMRQTAEMSVHARSELEAMSFGHQRGTAATDWRDETADLPFAVSAVLSQEEA